MSRSQNDLDVKIFSTYISKHIHVHVVFEVHPFKYSFQQFVQNFNLRTGPGLTNGQTGRNKLTLTIKRHTGISSGRKRTKKTTNE